MCFKAMVVCATTECYRNMKGCFSWLRVIVGQWRFPGEVTPKASLVIRVEVNPDEGEGHEVPRDQCE